MQFSISHISVALRVLHAMESTEDREKNFGKQFFFLALIFKRKMKLCFKESSSLSSSIENFGSQKAPSFNSVR